MPYHTNQQLVEEVIVTYGEIIRLNQSHHPYPIRHSYFSEIVACLELLGFPVECGAYEMEEKTDTQLPLPCIGIAISRTGDSRQEIRHETDEKRTSKLIDKLIHQNYLLRDQLLSLIHEYHETHHSSPHTLFTLWNDTGNFGESYLTFSGSLVLGTLPRELQKAWNDDFESELKLFRKFLTRCILETASRASLVKKLDVMRNTVDRETTQSNE